VSNETNRYHETKLNLYGKQMKNETLKRCLFSAYKSEIKNILNI